jgi:hypothetical protein
VCGPLREVLGDGLDRLIALGEFERIPGLLLRSGLADDTTAASIAIAAKKPDATLCLLTVLSPHELADDISGECSLWPSASPRCAPRFTIPRRFFAAWVLSLLH